jgi:hypothetical protein
MFEAMPDEFMPPALQTQPQLWAENQTLLEAFYRLNGTRQSGMNGAFAISMSEINAYCQMFEVDEVAEFFNAIAACDSVYLNYLRTLDKK